MKIYIEKKYILPALSWIIKVMKEDDVYVTSAIDFIFFIAFGIVDLILLPLMVLLSIRINWKR